MDGAFCGACHDGKIAFNARNKDTECGRCHLKVTSEMQKRFESFASDLPVANFGNGIDWPKAKREHLIKPSLSLNTPTVIMPLPDKLKIPLKLGTTSPRSDVLFSHEDHFPEFDCSNCHPDLFNIQKKGTETFTMDNNIFGYYCGACHLLVAFPMNNCRRCHPQMQNRSSF